MQLLNVLEGTLKLGLELLPILLLLPFQEEQESVVHGARLQARQRVSDRGEALDAGLAGCLFLQLALEADAQCGVDVGELTYRLEQ